MSSTYFVLILSISSGQGGIVFYTLYRFELQNNLTLLVNDDFSMIICIIFEALIGALIPASIYLFYPLSLKNATTKLYPPPENPATKLYPYEPH